MTFGGGTAGQEVFGELTILIQERQKVRVTSFVNKQTGEICHYQQDNSGLWSELSEIPAQWDVYPTQGINSNDEVSIDTQCKQEIAELINARVDLSKTVSRSSGSNNFTAPYRSLSITALSDDVTIDGQSVPQGFNWNVNSNQNEQIKDNTVVDGTDYISTLVQ